MPTTFSYASILSRIGQMLDQIGVKSIAIHEEEAGLFVEGFDGEGQIQVQMHYDIASLYELLCRPESQGTEYRVTSDGEGTLHRFLAEHDRELAGVSR